VSRDVPAQRRASAAQERAARMRRLEALFSSRTDITTNPVFKQGVIKRSDVSNGDLLPFEWHEAFNHCRAGLLLSRIDKDPVLLIHCVQTKFKCLVVKYAKAQAVTQLSTEVLIVTPSGYMSAHKEAGIIHLAGWETAPVFVQPLNLF